jgi:hypothetical protein
VCSTRRHPARQLLSHDKLIQPPIPARRTCPQARIQSRRVHHRVPGSTTGSVSFVLLFFPLPLVLMDEIFLTVAHRGRACRVSSFTSSCGACRAIRLPGPRAMMFYPELEKRKGALPQAHCRTSLRLLSLILTVDPRSRRGWISMDVHPEWAATGPRSCLKRQPGCDATMPG